MAVGQVSSVDPGEIWQLIETKTPSASTSETFSSISGYRTLMVSYKGLTLGTAGQDIRLRINGNSTTGNYASTAYNYIFLGYGNGAGSGYAIIYDANQAVPHRVQSHYGELPDEKAFFYGSPDVVTSLVVSPTSGTFTGTIYLYGLA